VPPSRRCPYRGGSHLYASPDAINIDGSGHLIST
jgi:hypothetical protein